MWCGCASDELTFGVRGKWSTRASVLQAVRALASAKVLLLARAQHPPSLLHLTRLMPACDQKLRHLTDHAKRTVYSVSNERRCPS